MKKITVIAFLLCGTACYGQKQKESKPDSMDIVVLRYTIPQYRLLISKIDSLDIPHLKTKEIFNYLDKYSVERIPVKKP